MFLLTPSTLFKRAGGHGPQQRIVVASESILNLHVNFSAIGPVRSVSPESSGKCMLEGHLPSVGLLDGLTAMLRNCRPEMSKRSATETLFLMMKAYPYGMWTLSESQASVSLAD